VVIIMNKRLPSQCWSGGWECCNTRPDPVYVRHYGLLANPNGAKLARAKAALHMHALNPQAQACAQDFMARVARVNIHQCPVCQQGRLGVVQTLARVKHLPDPFECSARKANSRAPPAQGP